MNMDENFTKELGIQYWKLNDNFQFKKNKIEQNKHTNFSKKESEFLLTISKAIGLDIEEKDSLKIYKYLVNNKILLDPSIANLMKDPDAKRKIWHKSS